MKSPLNRAFLVALICFLGLSFTVQSGDAQTRKIEARHGYQARWRSNDAETGRFREFDV